jgi:steroid 5-alpha reductase family enzyme
VFVTLLSLLSIVVKRNDIADVAWGVGIMLVATTAYIMSSEYSLLPTILLFLVYLWGIRLAVRIFLRNIKKSEDYRYKKWREEWGSWFYIRSYVQVYLLQGLLMIVVGYSAIHASIYGTENSLSVFTVFGIIIWCIGYYFEVVGDWQLDRFIHQKPEEGAVLTTGLWKYTRHPNYFGEVTMWWGLWIAVSPLPLSFIALMSPLMITFLILKVSGIPMLEKRFEGNPNFETYKTQTSAFFPLPPKRQSR